MTTSFFAVVINFGGHNQQDSEMTLHSGTTPDGAWDPMGCQEFNLGLGSMDNKGSPCCTVFPILVMDTSR